MEQKQAIWCLKRKYLNINVLFIDLLYKINITFVLMLILKKKRHPLCDFNYVKCKYIHFLPHILNFAIILNAVKEHALNARVHCLTRFINHHVSLG